MTEHPAYKNWRDKPFFPNKCLAVGRGESNLSREAIPLYGAVRTVPDRIKTNAVASPLCSMRMRIVYILVYYTFLSSRHRQSKSTSTSNFNSKTDPQKNAWLRLRLPRNFPKLPRRFRLCLIFDFWGARAKAPFRLVACLATRFRPQISDRKWLVDQPPKSCIDYEYVLVFWCQSLAFCIGKFSTPRSVRCDLIWRSEVNGTLRIEEVLGQPRNPRRRPDHVIRSLKKTERQMGRVGVEWRGAVQSRGLRSHELLYGEALSIG